MYLKFVNPVAAYLKRSQNVIVDNKKHCVYVKGAVSCYFSALPVLCHPVNRGSHCLSGSQPPPEPGRECTATGSGGNKRFGSSLPHC